MHGHLWLPVEQAMYIDDMMADRSSRINFEVYRTILSTQIRSNAAKLIGMHFTVQMNNNPKHITKATQDLLKAEYEMYLNGRLRHLS